MALPTVITPGDSGHITHHEEIHGLLDDVAAGFLVSQWDQGTLAARPAAGQAGALYWATNVPALYFDTGSAWQLVSPFMRRGYDVQTATLTLTPTYADVTGLSIAISTVVGSAPFVAMAAFEWNIYAVYPGTLEGQLMLNNVAQPGTSKFALGGNSSNAQQIVTTTGLWEGTCGAAGTQTFKLQAKKGVSGGGVDIQPGATSLLVMVFDG